MKAKIKGDSVVVSGYVNAVERNSVPLRYMRRGNEHTGKKYVERVQAGAFDRAIKKAASVPLRFNHGWDADLPGDIGSTAEGSLKLREDNIGLYAEATIKEPKVVEKARRGELTGWSFLFRCPAGGDTWEEPKDGAPLPCRTLKDIELLDVSVLDRKPAYPANSLHVESRAADDDGDADPGDVLEARSTDEVVETEEEKPPAATQTEEEKCAALRMERNRRALRILKLEE